MEEELRADRMSIKPMRLALGLAIIGFLFGGCGDQIERDAVHSVEYIIEENALLVDELKIESAYTYAFSPDGRFFIYTKPTPLCAPDVYLHDFQQNSEQRLTTNKAGIESDVAVDNEGNYAYVSTDENGSMGSSILYFNGYPLEGLAPGHIYRLPIFFGLGEREYLVFIEESGDNNWLFIIDMNSQERYSIPLSFYPLKLYYNDPKLYLTGMDYYGKLSCVCAIDVCDISEGAQLETLLESANTLLISGLKRGGISVDRVSSPNDGMYLFYAYHYLYGPQYLNPFAGTNDFYGRISWNQSARLLGMIKLYEKTGDRQIATQICQVVRAVLASNNAAQGIVNEWNPETLYASIKYGLSKNEPISLLAENASILNALTAAACSGLLGQDTIDEIITTGKEMYAYYDHFYSNVNQHYYIPYGCNFGTDGIIMPFNWQNIFGSALCNMYVLTGDETYAKRCHELAAAFQREFVYTKDGRLLWHYWPQEFYLGWSEDEGRSVHTPSREPYTDTLMEDISHASFNLMFILRYMEVFGEDVFKPSDLELLKRTVDGFVQETGNSRFISGDTEYQSPSYRFIPIFWTSIHTDKLKALFSAYYDFFPEYDWQALLYTYANCIENADVAAIDVTQVFISKEGEHTLGQTNTFVGSEIAEYAAQLRRWYK